MFLLLLRAFSVNLQESMGDGYLKVSAAGSTGDLAAQVTLQWQYGQTMDIWSFCLMSLFSAWSG